MIKSESNERAFSFGLSSNEIVERLSAAARVATIASGECPTALELGKLDEFTDSEAEWLERHLASCPRCESLVLTMSAEAGEAARFVALAQELAREQNQKSNSVSQIPSHDPRGKPAKAGQLSQKSLAVPHESRAAVSMIGRSRALWPDVVETSGFLAVAATVCFLLIGGAMSRSSAATRIANSTGRPGGDFVTALNVPEPGNTLANNIRMALCEQLSAETPENPEYFLCLGLKLAEQDRALESRKAFAQAIKMNQVNPSDRFELLSLIATQCAEAQLPSPDGTHGNRRESPSHQEPVRDF